MVQKCGSGFHYSFPSLHPSWPASHKRQAEPQGLARITGIQLYIGGFDGERAPAWHRITCIDGQVHHYLFHLRGVGLDMSQVREQQVSISICSPMSRRNSVSIPLTSRFKSSTRGRKT